MFLWVELIVRQLNETNGSENRIDKGYELLDRTPDILDSFYKRAVQKAKSNNPAFDLCLQWLLYSVEPLGVSQMYDAISGETRFAQ